mmetsp:Transcript_678/g.2145  ORF Transcript_678/g.2145 Transcript_678/m.2145 type:complete len:278 (-) Transcript_678:496-1329(-)
MATTEPKLNCLQRAFDGPTGKRWTMVPCLSDHIFILRSHLTGLFGAYTGCCGEAIEHDYVEAVMVSVNSTIDCPYCDGLHTELAALSGHGEAARKLLGAKDVASALEVVNKPGVEYARSMGEFNMRSSGEEAAYAKLEAAEGAGRARSIKALCVFLYWGGMTGNTVNCAKKRLLGIAPCSGLTPFSLLFFLWYGPLFFVVFFYNTVVIPLFRCVFGESSKSQVWFYKFTGFVLWFMALIWILPIGLLATVLSLCAPSLRGQVEGQLEIALGEAESVA